MVRLLFVGERPSDRARQLGATWRNGGLSGAVLHRALRSAGYDPLARNVRYWNIFVCSANRTSKWAVWRIRRAHADGWCVIGMGQKVQRILCCYNIPHLRLIHPAARGKIRYHATYDAHFREVLDQVDPITPW